MCEDQLKIFQADSVLYAVYISSYTLMELTPFVVVCLWPSSRILVLLAAWLEPSDRPLVTFVCIK